MSKYATECIFMALVVLASLVVLGSAAQGAARPASAPSLSSGECREKCHAEWFYRCIPRCGNNYACEEKCSDERTQCLQTCDN